MPKEEEMPPKPENGYLIVRYPQEDNPTAAGVTYTMDMRVVMAYIDEQHKRLLGEGHNPPDKFAIFRVAECMLDWS
jgi:hypothetical protein